MCPSTQYYDHDSPIQWDHNTRANQHKMCGRLHHDERHDQNVNLLQQHFHVWCYCWLILTLLYPAPHSPPSNLGNNGDICHTSNIDTPPVRTIYHRDSIWAFERDRWLVTDSTGQHAIQHPLLAGQQNWASHYPGVLITLMTHILFVCFLACQQRFISVKFRTLWSVLCFVLGASHERSI